MITRAKGDSVLLAPPLIVDEADIDEILERLADAVRKLDACPRVETT